MEDPVIKAFRAIDKLLILLVLMFLINIAMFLMTLKEQKELTTFKTMQFSCESSGGKFTRFRIPEGFGIMCTFPNSLLPNGGK